MTFTTKHLRLIEFIALAIILPSIIIFGQLGKYMLVFLWGATIYCIFAYRNTPEAKDIPVWRWAEVNWKNMKTMLLRFAVCSMLLLGFISVYDPERRFDLLLNRNDIWVRVMLFYPLLSALQQEFIFCTFFFVRYAMLFPKERTMIWVSTIVFAYAHILFINPVAPTLSLIAGYFFATTYAKHRSLALVTIEHALYGNMIFTLGLGWYFWGGALR
jgi:hypothetical protein